MSQSRKIIMKPTGNTSTKGKSGTETKVKETFPTKVIVRRLPPTLTSDLFLEEISPLADHTYYNFVAADRSLGQYAYCRAVINFKNADDLFIFREKFDNYVFVDPRGNEYPAVVEFAPYQKVPIVSRKVDHRENTLDDDADYKKFLELLETPEVPPTFTVKDVIEEVEAKAKERIAAQNSETPLLAFINKFKIEKKRAQEKLREERRLRELERKRLRDEEKRIRRDRERRERDESKSTKDIISSSDKKGDSKRAASKDEQKMSSAKASKQDMGKASTTAARPNTISGKSTIRGSEKNSSVTKKTYPEDDIIVRTLPSAKSKAAEKNRSAKAAAEPKKPTVLKASNKPDAEKQSAGAKPGSGKPKPEKQTSAASGGKASEKPSSAKPQTSDKASTKSTNQKSSRETLSTKEKSSAFAKKQERREEKGEDKSKTKDGVSELSDKAALLKLADKSEKTGRDRTPPSIKCNLAGYKLERSGSGDSGTSDKNDGDGSKSRADRSTRYKDRPERAIYNPGARAAERRAKQTNPVPTAATEMGDGKNTTVEKKSGTEKQSSPSENLPSESTNLIAAANKATESADNAAATSDKPPATIEKPAALVPESTEHAAVKESCSPSDITGTTADPSKPE